MPRQFIKQNQNPQLHTATLFGAAWNSTLHIYHVQGRSRWVRQVGWGSLGRLVIFQKTCFLAVSDHSEHLSNNRVGEGQGGFRWVQVGQFDGFVGGQEVDSQDHHELADHKGHVMHSQ